MKSQILTANLVILVSKIGVFYHNNITPNRKIRENNSRGCLEDNRKIRVTDPYKPSYLLVSYGR
jgi:hypothetical protein